MKKETKTILARKNDMIVFPMPNSRASFHIDHVKKGWLGTASIRDDGNVYLNIFAPRKLELIKQISDIVEVALKNHPLRVGLNAVNTPKSVCLSAS